MESTTIKRLAVLTSGGDAPGMNAAIRGVVRTAHYHKLDVYGIFRGYQGMIEGDLQRLDVRKVGNILHRGGTILKTARSEAFRTASGRHAAFEALQAFEIDAVITIGGDGTLTGAHTFTGEYPINFVGIPGTIDNDLYGTDNTIGFDTACNTALEAIDRIRDTADSHNRLFFIEVMGRHSGFIALNSGIGGGAGSVLIPESGTSLDDLVEKLRKDYRRKKLFSLVVVAEGNRLGGAATVAQMVQERLDVYDTKVTIIGHLQRGGAPTCFDRVLASKLGYGAVEGLLNGTRNCMVGLINNKLTYTPLEQVIQQPKPLDQDLMRMADILAM